MSDLPRNHQPTADPDGSDDRRLLAAFAERDDRDALGRLLLRHAGVMFRVALRFSGNAADAEDAVQEACLDAMRAARSFRGDGSVRGWLLAAVHNRCRMRARGERRRRQREAIQAPRGSQPPPEDLVATVQAALAKLPDHERVAIELRCIDGLAHAEIASVTGRREATVRKQVERGLARLRALLGAAGFVAGVGALVAALAAQATPATPSTALAEALAKIATTGPSPSAIVGSSLVAAGMAGGLVLAAIGGVGLWTPAAPASRAVPRAAAVAPLAEPVPQLAPEPGPLAKPVTLHLPRGDIADAMDVLEQQAGFTAVLPPSPMLTFRRVGRIEFGRATRPRDVVLMVEGVPLRTALDRLAASGWSWRRIAGRICLWRALDPALRADALRRLSTTADSPDEGASAAYALTTDRDPAGLRDLLAAVLAGGRPGEAARMALKEDDHALLVLAEDAEAQRMVRTALARTPDDPFWLVAAGQVRALAEAPRLRGIVAGSVEPRVPDGSTDPESMPPPGWKGDALIAATCGLGWMGEAADRALLETVARDHWAPRVRATALAALGERADRASFPLLRTMLASTPRPPDQLAEDLPPLLMSVVACAPRIEQASVVREIFLLGERTSLRGRVSADGVISLQGRISLRGVADPAAWRDCVAMLADPRRPIGLRFLACTALGAGSDRPDIREALLGVVEDANLGLADLAARALAVHADEALVERLARRLTAVEGGSELIYGLSRALGYTRLARAAEHLLRFAPQEPKMAWRVIDAAVETGQPVVAARLRDMLAPGSPTFLRRLAAEHVVGDDPAATARLIGALLEDDEQEVRVVALTRLREAVPHLDRIAALGSALKEAAWEVRYRAVNVLRWTDVPPAALARSILPLSRDSSHMVRQEVASALPLGLDDDDVWQAIERLAVGDPHVAVRSNCLDQLGSLLIGSTDGGHPRLVRAIELLNRMRADTEGSIRDRAQRLLEQQAAHHPLAARLARESVAPADAKPAAAVPGQPPADF